MDTAAHLSLPSAQMPADNADHPNTEWQFEDFFMLNEEEELKIKRQLAVQMRLRYADKVTICGGPPFAVSVAGISPYDEDKVKQRFEEYILAKEANAFDEREGSQFMALTLNACQIAWRPAVRVNVGYVKWWAETKLEHWDANIERRAGGVNANLPWSAQSFFLTNMSSLYALLATIVMHLQHKTPIPQRLLRSASGVRVLLCFHASTSDILVGRSAVRVATRAIAICHPSLCLATLSSKARTILTGPGHEPRREH
jgi:hypothetical protein